MTDDKYSITRGTAEKPSGMRINLLTEPYGVDRERLVFSFSVNDSSPCEYMTAYRLKIENARGGVVFDSGRIISDNCTALTFPSLAQVLLDDTLYYWSVAAENSKGESAGFSDRQAFTTSVGKWENCDGIWCDGDDDFTFLRHEFNTGRHTGKLIRAVMSVTARSPEPTRQYVYTVYINGQPVGCGPCRYGEADGEKLLYYNTYDITGLITDGNNCVSAVCFTTKEKQFLCRIVLFYDDGTRDVAVNSGRDFGKWYTLPGDNVFGKDNSIGTGYYTAYANNINAEIYPYGFNCARYNSAGWQTGTLCGDISQDMKLVPFTGENIHRYEYGHPVCVRRLDGGDYVADLGREIVGGTVFELYSPVKCVINVYYGEQLNSDGTVRYRMLTGNVYKETFTLASGNNRIETVDMLTYRYIEISGYPGELTRESITPVEVRRVFKEDLSDFSCDSLLLSDMYKLTKHTVKVTSQDIYVDSQSRERGAYEGDMLINMYAAYAFDNDYATGRATLEYLYTHRTWPAEYILYTVIAVKLDYMYTGDISSLRDNYKILREKNFTRFIDSVYGLLTLGNREASGTDAVLVDWPTGERDGYDMSVKFNTVLNAVAVKSYEDMAFIAEALGYCEDAYEYRRLSRLIKNSMLEYLYDGASGRLCDGLYDNGTQSEHFSQHAGAFALYAGVYIDKNEARRIATALYRDSEGKIRMSVYGAFFLMCGLFSSGNGDIAQLLLTDPRKEPGARTWARMIYTEGATVTAEAWGPDSTGNMTFSHPWGAAPVYAIVNGIFGINPTKPGFSEFEIRLSPYAAGEASVTVPTIKGDIHAEYKKNEQDGLRLLLNIPCGTNAKVILPDGEYTTVTLDGTVLHKKPVVIGSGEHVITAVI